MIKKIKQIFAVLAMSGMLFAPLAVAPLAHAQCDPNQANIQGCVTEGACLSTNQATCTQSADPNGSVNRIITTVINVFSLVVGVVSVIMIIIGGLRYITSGGDSGNVTNAKNTILYAIVGLVIVALAQVIVHFVLARVTGTGA